MEVEAQQKLEQTKQDIDNAVNNPVSSFCLRNVRRQVLHLAFSPDLFMGLLCSDHVTSRLLGMSSIAAILHAMTSIDIAT